MMLWRWISSTSRWFDLWRLKNELTLQFNRAASFVNAWPILLKTLALITHFATMFIQLCHQLFILLFLHFIWTFFSKWLSVTKMPLWTIGSWIRLQRFGKFDYLARSIRIGARILQITLTINRSLEHLRYFHLFILYSLRSTSIPSWWRSCASGALQDTLKTVLAAPRNVPVGQPVMRPIRFIHHFFYILSNFKF